VFSSNFGYQVRRNVLCFVLAVLLLGACANQLSTPQQTKETGTVFFSFGSMDDIGQTEMSLYFRSDETKAFTQVMYIEGRSKLLTFFDPLDVRKRDIEEGSKRATVFLMHLPPGNYELYKWRAVSCCAPFAKSIESSEPFTFRFSVRSNEALYLGEFLAQNFGYFVTANEFERDLAIAKTKFSGTALITPKQLIPTPETLSSRYFKFKKKAD
jgi:hypothetical protein